LAELADYSTHWLLDLTQQLQGIESTVAYRKARLIELRDDGEHNRGDKDELMSSVEGDDTQTATIKTEELSPVDEDADNDVEQGETLDDDYDEEGEEGEDEDMEGEDVQMDGGLQTVDELQAELAALLSTSIEVTADLHEAEASLREAERELDRSRAMRVEAERLQRVLCAKVRNEVCC